MKAARFCRTISLPLALATCGGQPPPEEALAEGPSGPAPAAAIAPMGESTQLDEKLQQLQRELAAALRADGTAERRDHLVRAEAISDRLLESELPFEWLSNGYDVESRLRQIQSLADRIMARARRDVPPEQYRPDVLALYREVSGLRTSLATPGSRAPVPLDSLLAPSRRGVRSPATPPAGAVPE